MQHRASFGLSFRGRRVPDSIQRHSNRTRMAEFLPGLGSPSAERHMFFATARQSHGVRELMPVIRPVLMTRLAYLLVSRN